MNETKVADPAPAGATEAEPCRAPCRPAALMVAAMLLAANCIGLTKESADESTCLVEDVDVDSDDDADGDGVTTCNAGDSSAGSQVITRSPPQFQPGGSVVLKAEAHGDPSRASASGTHSHCYEAGQAANLSGNVSLGKTQYDEFCPGQTGTSVLELQLLVSKNGGPAEDVINATATLECDSDTVVVDDFFNCNETIEGRFPCTGDGFRPDIETLEPGDQLKATLRVTTYNQLSSPEAVEAGVMETEIGATYFLSAPGLTPTDCPNAEACSTEEDCFGDALCLDEECIVPSFAQQQDFSFSTFPDPLVSGQAFDVTFNVAVHDNQLFPYRAVVGVPEEAVSQNGPLFAGLIAGVCHLEDSNFNLVVLPSLDELLADLDGNGLPGASEPVAKFGPNGNGEFEVLVTLPSTGGRATLPVDATLSCSLPAFLIAGANGSHPLNGEWTSIDLDTLGEDNGQGSDPFHFTSDGSVVLQIGDLEVVLCGDATSSGASLNVAAAEKTAGAAGVRGAEPSPITAADALRVLRVAVGSATCEACVCDVNSSGTITTSDALLVLRVAVGQDVMLNCPDCEQE